MSPCFWTGTRDLSNVTFPGPRNLWSEIVATDGVNPRPPPVSPATFGSDTQTLIGTGWFTVPLNVAATASGGPVTFAPSCENDSTGGWLPIPSSLYGLMGYPLFS